MTTPVCDFVRSYAASDTVRMHMPGHKGLQITGPEARDITEIKGAGELYEAAGPIAEAEANTAELFGTACSCWSTEGSSQCIRAMLALAAQSAPGKSRVVLAARNAHRAFLTACALLDLEVRWLFPQKENDTLCSCLVTAEQVEAALQTLTQPPAAVYLTSPDYLGGMQDVKQIAERCHAHGVPLLVDNAHGAYLRFLQPSEHPISLGADLCCDSAHKTLPALTGCAYLHVSRTAPASFAREAKRMLALFGSTSPSWLLLQSLDAVNAELAGEYPLRLRRCIDRLSAMKQRLSRLGWQFTGQEPLKLTVSARVCGYTGPELADLLRLRKIECEYADPDYLVLMPSPVSPDADLQRLEDALRDLPVRKPLPQPAFRLPQPERVMSAREAMLAPAEPVLTAQAEGRILASASMSCPPAVSVYTAGERIGREGLPVLRHYGIDEILAVKEKDK